MTAEPPPGVKGGRKPEEVAIALNPSANEEIVWVQTFKWVGMFVHPDAHPSDRY
jgi:hypothetical protein